MKFTLSWLRDHLDDAPPLDEITRALTMVGLEVESVVDMGARLKGFEVAEIVATAPHPQADRLKICTVKSGGGTQELVCGAPNARVGLKGIVANEGAVIPSSGVQLARVKIRGVESAAMLCSPAELEIADDTSGIIELPDAPPIGTPAARALGLDETIIEIAITPNRPDCLGVRGIARDLAALGLGKLKPPPAHNIMGDIAGGGAFPIAIKLESDSCPTFAAALVRGVKNGDSPDWLARRLRAIGLRPINALVDITNYISYDAGRPLHVYDADKLNGAVTARQGKAGESFTALDGEEYHVTPEDCVIADSKSVLGLGGVMGGEASGVTAATQNVLVESAWFAPAAIAASGRRHRIESDARYRFERGVDPQSTEHGRDMAVAMILDLCGGERAGAVLAGTPPDGRKQVTFDPAQVARLSGVDVPPARMAEILTALGFAIKKGKIWTLTAPSWRPDIDGAADIVEEVVRIYGLDKVPATPLPPAPHRARPILRESQLRPMLARRALAARGLVEAVTWSFISAEQAARFGGGAARIANPISRELSDMRPSLLPNLLAAAARNIDRGIADIGLFEVGQIFTAATPHGQSIHAAGVRRGGTARHWQAARAPADAFLVRADAEAVLAHIGIAPMSLTVRAEAPDWYHPGRSGLLCRDPRTPLAYFGELHPALMSFFDIDGAVAMFEVLLDAIPPSKAKHGATRPAPNLSNLQAVRRDFAFEVADAVAAQELIRAAAGADKKLIARVSLFDAFSGKGVATGMKSLAIEVTLQPRAATLTDAEIEAVSEKIIAAVEKATGGTLRA